MVAEPLTLDLAFLWLAACTIYPESSLRALKNRFDFLLACLRIRGELSSWLGRPENAALRDELRQRPRMLGFVVWPYVHAEWSVMERFEALSQHRRALQDDMARVDVGLDGEVLIADLHEVSPGLRLVVDRAPWCLREGSLVFNQFVGEDRLMSVAFSFGMREGRRIVYVGSVQGSNVESALAIYREIGKDLLGMRSRDYVIKAFQLLMFHMGVQEVLCIAEDARHHRHPYFGREKAEKFHLNYDVIWEEHSATPGSDGFHRLGRLPIKRPMEDIARKNRSLYKKRYAMMDALSLAIAARFGTPASAALSVQEEAAASSTDDNP